MQNWDITAIQRREKKKEKKNNQKPKKPIYRQNSIWWICLAGKVMVSPANKEEEQADLL